MSTHCVRGRFGPGAPSSPGFDELGAPCARNSSPPAAAVFERLAAADVAEHPAGSDLIGPDPR